MRDKLVLRLEGQRVLRSEEEGRMRRDRNKTKDGGNKKVTK